MNEFQMRIADMLAENCWTSDIPRLETQDFWYVFTYSEKKGKLSSYFTHDSSDSEFLSIGWTNSAIYSILNVSVGEKTLQLANPTGTDRILGEVWMLPTEVLLDLDCDERNLLHTRRVMVPIRISKGRTIDAWMYTVEPSLLRKGPVRVSKYSRYTYYGNEKYLEIV